MARVDKKRSKKTRAKYAKKSQLPFTKRNYQIFGFGILVLILGYISMMQGPVDSFWSLTLAPVLLVIGYVIIIPYSFFYRDKKPEPPSNPVDAGQGGNAESG
ncbi:hypothetical protein ACFL5L_05470 [candidate division KSB1 bacterium]